MGRRYNLCVDHNSWLYLAIVIDLFSHQVIGWSMSKQINKALVCDALLMALWPRGIPKGVIVHTDRGSQYCSKKYQQQLTDNKLICSMSGKGCCYDNAVAKSFFHSLKVECVYDYTFSHREQAKKIIFEYIEIYYNQQRLHSSIGYKTPVGYEQLCT
ncbi:IS3 family transposase [Spartinivicinus ruber]|nr:IS3 family transposase [Spartinivicinus ruber]